MMNSFDEDKFIISYNYIGLKVRLYMDAIFSGCHNIVCKRLAYEIIQADVIEM